MHYWSSGCISWPGTKSICCGKPGEQLTKEEIIAYCKEKLAPYKVPKDIEFIDTLPKSAIGKILRKEVRGLERKKREQIS